MNPHDNRVSKRITKELKENENRSVHNRLAVYELKTIASSYNDILLNEAIERCAQIIFNQESTINAIKLEKIFEKYDL